MGWPIVRLEMRMGDAARKGLRPRYRIRTEGTGDTVFHRLIDEQGNLSVTIAPSIGGQVFEMDFMGNSLLNTPSDAAYDKPLLELRHTSTSDHDFLQKVGMTVGIPPLFPWPNRVDHASFVYGGKTVHLKPNTAEGFSLHGLVLGRGWKVEEKEATEENAHIKVGLRLADFPDIISDFPFALGITIDWIVHDRMLEFKTTVANEGDEVAPMGLGFHVNYRVPFRGGALRRRDDCTVTVPARSYWELEDHAMRNGRLIPTGRRISVEASRFDLRKPRRVGELNLDDVFTDLETRNGWVTCRVRDGASNVTVSAVSDEGFKHICVYVPQHGNCIAVEPYTCPTDAFNLEEKGIMADVVTLNPGSTWSGTVKIIPKLG